MVAHAGQVVRASDTQVLWARKTVDESITSSTTLQNDDSLLLAVEADAVYEIAGTLFYAGNVTGDIKVAFTFPTGATLYWAGKGGSEADAGYGGVGASRHSASVADASGTATAFTGSTTNLAIFIRALLVTSGTSGNLQLQWAQNTSNGTATTVKVGSYLRAIRRE